MNLLKTFICRAYWPERWRHVLADDDHDERQHEARRAKPQAEAGRRHSRRSHDDQFAAAREVAEAEHAPIKAATGNN